MCGIGGILFSDQGLVHRLTLMQAAMGHRGPDDQGIFVSEEAGLAHTRLALLDLEGGRQPRVDPSGRYALVFNGEIYNHQELRAQLRDFDFRTGSDAETLLAAWMRWGQGCLPRLQGMFAFVIWDGRLRRAFAARDALGVKPLVYAVSGQEVVFASEARAILAQGHAARVDEEALVEVVVAPAFSGVRRSMFEGIRHLPAGCLMNVDQRGVRVERWWEPRFCGAPEVDDDELAARLRGALERGVERAMRADVPVGIFLSGGLDSTALAAIAARHCAGQALAAFTIRFEDHDQIGYRGDAIVVSDDAPFAEAAAEALGLELIRVVATQRELSEAVARVAAQNDRVPAWEQELSQDALARAARGRRKAVLVGDAADETHFGYFFLLDDAVNRSPLALIERFGARQRAAFLSERLRRDHDPLRALPLTYQRLVEAEGYSFDGPPEARVQAVSCLVRQLWLGRLLHNGDAHTMAHGVEARVPFADLEVLACAQATAPSQGWRGGVEKHTLRQAVAPLLPAAIATRRKSALPRDPRLGRLYQEALREVAAAEGDFVRQYLDAAQIEGLSSKPDLSDNERATAFTLLALLHWKRHHLG